MFSFKLKFHLSNKNITPTLKRMDRSQQATENARFVCSKKIIIGVELVLLFEFQKNSIKFFFYYLIMKR